VLDLTFPVQVLALILDMIALYYAVLFVASLTTKKTTVNYAQVKPKTRFAILIPAHNEERVLSELLQDLSEQNYEKTLYDVYIINDASTDNTLGIACEFVREYPNFHLIHRRVGGGGKPAALNHALHNLRREISYDAIAIFDADNRVEEMWLRKVDYQHQTGNALIQTNVKTKNPNQSLLTRLIHYEYLAFGRIWQLGKSRLQWCNAFAGTGMSIKYSLLKQFGLFDETALTEDLELTIRLFNEGYRVTYLHDAYVWDEKPASLHPFFNQRVRWATGHMLACRKLLGHGSLIGRWEANFYLFAIVMPLAVLAAWILSILQLLNLVSFEPQTTFVWIFASFAFAFTMLIAGLQEKDRGIIRYLIPLHIYLYHWIIVVLWSFLQALRPQKKWAKTPHNYTSTPQR
jgi:cellulose synthase/poly-beta-1,6-N-acetylglucosamine synthase-like glycosyltransferase